MNYDNVNSIFEYYGWSLQKDNKNPKNEKNLYYIYMNPEYPTDEFKIETNNASFSLSSTSSDMSSLINVSVPMPRSNYCYKNKVDLMDINIEHYIEEHLNNYNEKMCVCK